MFSDIKSRLSDFIWNITRTRLQKNVANIVFIALSVFALIGFICLRFVWAFSGISIAWAIVFYIAAVAIIVIARNFVIPFWLYAIGCGFAKLCTIFNLILLINSLPDFPHAWNYFVEMLPILIAGGIAIGGYYFVKNYWRQAVAGLVVVAVSITFALCIVYGIAPIWFKTGPVVFDGGDSYVVEFLTNVDGLGFVEVQNGSQTETYFAVSDGRKVTDTTIHKVEIPKNELEGKTYRIGATQNIVPTKNKNYFGYSIRGNWTTFKKISTDEVRYLAASDTHSQFGGAKNISRNLDGIDFLVILGDSISFIHTRSDVENILIKGMADISKGEIPVYYVRGNHETMGSNPQYLKDYIVTPTGEYYYTFTYHDFFGIVLDSGDGNAQGTTKEQVGSFPQYLDKQTEWLKQVEAEKAYQSFKFKACLVHIPLDSGDSDLTKAFSNWNGILGTIGIDYSISGHTHNYVFQQPDAKTSFYRVQTGGGDVKKGIYTCTFVLMNQSGAITFQNYNQKADLLLIDYFNK